MTRVFNREEFTAAPRRAETDAAWDIRDALDVSAYDQLDFLFEEFARGSGDDDVCCFDAVRNEVDETRCPELPRTTCRLDGENAVVAVDTAALVGHAEGADASAPRRGDAHDLPRCRAGRRGGSS